MIGFVKAKSFHDFNKLCLKGKQKILSFGEYCSKINTTKDKRRKVITYNYNNLLRRL